MSSIAARRLLAKTTQDLVKSSHIKIAQIEAVVDALSQVVTTETGIACRLVLRIKSGDIDAVKEKLE